MIRSYGETAATRSFFLRLRHFANVRCWHKPDLKRCPLFCRCWGHSRHLIEYAKSNPGKINIASAGLGTGPYVACELFKMMTGADMVQVPYKASYMTDLLGGQIPIAFAPIAQIIQDVEAGKLTAIGVTTPTRSDAAPQIPAIAEFVPGYEASGWYGMCAPTGTPDEVVEKLNAATTTCVTDPNLKSRLLNLGVEPMPMPVANFKKFVADEIAKYAKVIQFAGVKVE
jgi:tripartite-type tricarboxylate transporter receptor subunit TctC